jgi:hypothetical protein
MDCRKLMDTERTALLDALRSNADAGQPIFMGRDTSFVPTNRVREVVGGHDAASTNEVTDDEVICAIKSVPCHY